MKQTRLIFLAAALALILIGAFWLATVLKRRREAQASPAVDAQSPYKKKELQEWIQQLSSADADERKRAESELANAGVFSDSALKAAEDKAAGPAKEAIQRLLNRRRFAGLQDLDYAKALPSDSFAYLHVPAIQDVMAKSEKTAFGKLVKRPAMEGMRKKIWQQLERDETGAQRQPPLDYFKGQFAAALFKTPEQNRDRKPKLGVLLELKGSDPQGEYLEWSGNLIKAGASIQAYKDIETLDSGVQKGAIARTGNSILFGSDAGALHVLIDTVLSGNGVSSNPEMKKVRGVLGASPDALLFADIPSIAIEVMLSHATEARKPEDDIGEMMLEKLGYGGASTTCTADGFEERLACLLPEGPGAIMAALTASQESPPPMASFQFVPADAVAAAILYLDGAKLEKAIIELYEDVRKVRGADKMPPPDKSPVFISLRVVEKLLGIKEGGILDLIKGEVGAWVELKGAGDLTSAELSGFVTAVDDKSADILATILERMNALQPSGVFTKSVFNQHTIRSVNPAKNGEEGRALTWMVDGNRVYFASSVQSMKKQLEHAQKRLPGLLKREPLQNALKNFKADEQAGNVLYLDSQAILTRGADIFFLRLMCDPATPKELMEAVTQLPPPVDLFKDFPPLLAFTGTRKDRAELIVRSPLPLIPMALAAFWNDKNRDR